MLVHGDKVTTGTVNIVKYIDDKFEGPKLKLSDARVEKFIALHEAIDVNKLISGFYVKHNAGARMRVSRRDAAPPGWRLQGPGEPTSALALAPPGGKNIATRCSDAQPGPGRPSDRAPPFSLTRVAAPPTSPSPRQWARCSSRRTSSTGSASSSRSWCGGGPSRPTSFTSLYALYAQPLTPVSGPDTPSLPAQEAEKDGGVHRAAEEKLKALEALKKQYEENSTELFEGEHKKARGSARRAGDAKAEKVRAMVDMSILCYGAHGKWSQWEAHAALFL